MKRLCDIIIVGGGHAGVEAAIAAAKFGLNIILATLDERALGRMSCNPAIGGLAKSQVVRELDGLGGIMGRCADITALQYRVLNRKNGAAVRATRTQNDREDYSIAVRQFIKYNPRIIVISSEVEGLKVAQNRVIGVILEDNSEIECKAVILATGTFLGGKIFIGRDEYPAGRRDEPAANNLAAWLRAQGIRTLRFKTGTPPRIERASVEFDKIIEQSGEDDYRPFAFSTDFHIPVSEQSSCFITRANENTCALVRENIHLSPMFDGRIEGVGPRYCPSIEAKVVRFPDRTSHSIFLEPEGRNSEELYVNGLSMSLPKELQERILRTIRGLENAVMTQPGYAVEYDCIVPTQLRATLEHEALDGLYFAGQVNGTSGYEEAAGQGVLAGIGAALALRGEEPFIMSRKESYIAVMIDDLRKVGTDEPYRLFTARAEHRLRLREDNAIFRMLPYAEKYSLLPRDIIYNIANSFIKCENDIERLNKTFMPSDSLPFSADGKKLTAAKFLKLSDTNYSDLIASGIGDASLPQFCKDYIETEISYEGFIRREDRRVENIERILCTRIPDNLDFRTISSLSSEAVERLLASRPKSLHEASLQPGITPADIFSIYTHLKRKMFHMKQYNK